MEDAKLMERRYLIMEQHFQQHQIGYINRQITVQDWFVTLIILFLILFISISFFKAFIVPLPSFPFHFLFIEDWPSQSKVLF